MMSITDSFLDVIRKSQLCSGVSPAELLFYSLKFLYRSLIFD